MFRSRVFVVLSAVGVLCGCASQRSGSISRDLEVICSKEGVEIKAVRPSDEVVEVARKVDASGNIAALGKDWGNASARAELEVTLQRLKAEQPDLSRLELQLYLISVSYCSGGLSEKSYQDLVDMAHRGVLTADAAVVSGDERTDEPLVEIAVRQHSGEIVFYEGNGGTQDVVDETDDRAGQFFRPRVNDEARSVVLRNVRRGCIITVYDNSDGKKSDDYCVIRVLKPSPRYIVSSFERSYRDEFVDVQYKRRDNLDGKVSRVRIE